MHPHWLVRMEDPCRWKPFPVLGFNFPDASFGITAETIDNLCDRVDELYGSLKLQLVAGRDTVFVHVQAQQRRQLGMLKIGNCEILLEKKVMS